MLRMMIQYFVVNNQSDWSSIIISAQKLWRPVTYHLTSCIRKLTNPNPAGAYDVYMCAYT